MQRKHQMKTNADNRTLSAVREIDMDKVVSLLKELDTLTAEDGTVQILVRIPENLHKRIVSYPMSLSEIAADALWKWLDVEELGYVDDSEDENEDDADNL